MKRLRQLFYLSVFFTISYGCQPPDAPSWDNGKIIPVSLMTELIGKSRESTVTYFKKNHFQADNNQGTNRYFINSNLMAAQSQEEDLSAALLKKEDTEEYVGVLYSKGIVKGILYLKANQKGLRTTENEVQDEIDRNGFLKKNAEGSVTPFDKTNRRIYYMKGDLRLEYRFKREIIADYQVYDKVLTLHSPLLD